MAKLVLGVMKVPNTTITMFNTVDESNNVEHQIERFKPANPKSARMSMHRRLAENRLGKLGCTFPINLEA